MRFSVAVASLLMGFFLVVAELYGAEVLYSGVVTVVLPEQGVVVIDHQQYPVAKDALIYNRSNPGRLLSISDLVIGQMVVYDLFHKNDQEHELKTIVIHDGR